MRLPSRTRRKRCDGGQDDDKGPGRMVWSASSGALSSREPVSRRHPGRYQQSRIARKAVTTGSTRHPPRIAAPGQPQPRDRQTPAWLLSPANGNAESARAPDGKVAEAQVRMRTRRMLRAVASAGDRWRVLCPEAATRAAPSVVTETVASRRERQRHRLAERVVRVLPFRDSRSRPGAARAIELGAHA
jgi:hypothetical protein